MIVENMEKTRIVPVIALPEARDVVPLCKALKAGGLEVAEITFRTVAAREAIRIAAQEFPEFMLGAGTVTTLEELEAAKTAGAQFAVAPGFNPVIVSAAQQMALPFFPGVATPSEIEGALSCGCNVLKFFPAGEMGGIKMLKALYGPYGHRAVRFIPTGGVTLENMKDYLSTPGVLAIGGSWIVAGPILKAKDWEQVTRLTRAAVEVAKSLP